MIYNFVKKQAPIIIYNFAVYTISKFRVDLQTKRNVDSFVNNTLIRHQILNSSIVNTSSQQTHPPSHHLVHCNTHYEQIQPDMKTHRYSPDFNIYNPKKTKAISSSFFILSPHDARALVFTKLTFERDAFTMEFTKFASRNFYLSFRGEKQLATRGANTLRSAHTTGSNMRRLKGLANMCVCVCGRIQMRIVHMCVCIWVKKTETSCFPFAFTFVRRKKNQVFTLCIILVCIALYSNVFGICVFCLAQFRESLPHTYTHPLCLQNVCVCESIYGNPKNMRRTRIGERPNEKNRKKREPNNNRI